MAEYLADAVQSVALNQAATFDASIPCNRGYVFHEDGTGIFILRGIVNNPSCNRARYQVIARGNIALPTGATVVPIAMALALNGETRPTSRAIYTPAAVEEYGNICCSAIVDIPRGCCFTLSLRNVAATDDPTVVPAPLINLQNASFEVTRIA